MDRKRFVTLPIIASFVLFAFSIAFFFGFTNPNYATQSMTYSSMTFIETYVDSSLTTIESTISSYSPGDFDLSFFLPFLAGLFFLFEFINEIYFKDKDGNKVAYSDEQKAEVYNTAKSILYQINTGASFEELMEQYNEASEGTISFGKGDKEENYEETAFNLEKGEVSGVVELSDGYVILQCVSTFNKEETEANKVKIVEERKKEVFGEQYDDFVETLTRELNTNLWEQITLPEDEEIVTDSFFDVYEKYFASEFTS